MGNPLEEFFWANEGGPQIHKWLHYFEIYHRHLERFRDQPITVVEFGVSQGGSLAMWRDYFGPKAKIVGVDINPRCERFAENGTEILIGDQEDRAFLRSLRERVGPVDVLIEDGGHTMDQQIATFEEMFRAVVDDGIYLVEDLHTSYWRKAYGERFGGGYKRRGTFIEYAKDLIDQMHAWHSHTRRLQVTTWTRQIAGMHIYDSVIVFDKGRVEAPEDGEMGQRTFE